MHIHATVSSCQRVTQGCRDNMFHPVLALKAS
jgi:hypothetical protein